MCSKGMTGMDKYQYLKCPGHYVSERFLNRFSRRRHTKPCYPSNRLFRLAVIHQQAVLRRWLREELDTDQFSLDHHPVPFSALKRIFFKQKGFNPDQLTGQNPTIKLLKDWQLFHGALAEYRVIEPDLDLLLAQRHLTYWHNQDKKPALVPRRKTPSPYR